VGLRRAIREIREAPERWPADEDGLRSCRVYGFPHRLIYWTNGRLSTRPQGSTPSNSQGVTVKKVGTLARPS
jgi:hypothetical protein